jgi:negative regulator of replication initiation
MNAPKKSLTKNLLVILSQVTLFNILMGGLFMRTIRISEEVYGEIAKRGSFGETPDDVLRRVFKLPNKSEGIRTGGRRSPRKSTNRMSTRVENGKLHVSFQTGNAESWDLPSKNDTEGIREVRDQAVKFAEMYDATVGQVNAVKKALTDNGYYVSR